MLPSIILRHKKENLKKCSLRGLENHPDFRFFTYPKDPLPDISSYLILTLDKEAPILSEQDKDKPLLLIDATWRYAPKMLNSLSYSKDQLRALPDHYKTAYPRYQTLCPEPERGLASIEALYVSFHILKKEKEFLLDHYHFKNLFLSLNNFKNN
jgi:pre-rRNA-processing protein TSR3